MAAKKSGNSKSKKSVAGKKSGTKKSATVKRRTSSIIRNIFGSSYKKQLAIKKAQEDAAKLNSKNKLMRFVSEARKNKIAKNLPILLYTIILALNKIGKSLPQYSIQKNPIFKQIYTTNAPFSVKFNQLIRYLQYQIKYDFNDATVNKPDVIFNFYSTFLEMKKLIENNVLSSGKKRLKIDDFPDFMVNTIVLGLNFKKIMKDVQDEYIYKEYFKNMYKFIENNDIDDSELPSDKKLEKEYILLLQDILLCDIDSAKCGLIKTSGLPPKDKAYGKYTNKNNDEVISYKFKTKDDFKKFIADLRLNNLPEESIESAFSSLT